MQADREVAQGGHDLRSGAFPDLGQVLAEGHVPHPVQSILDLPVPADPGGEFVGPGLVRGQVGDGVDGLGVPAARAAGPGGDRAGAADDLDGLAGVRERDARRDGDDLEDADFLAAVAGLGAAVGVTDLPPGQFGELAAQGGLVALDRQDPVRAAGVQIRRVFALCVQCVL